ncbi:MAG: trypsin-like serine protease [Parcubacteria group bacterium]|nr:trypsin-like serine protease [Parcubacteria group bacterium]
MGFFLNEYQQTIKAVAKALSAVIAVLILKRPDQIEGKLDQAIIAQLPRNQDGLIRFGNCSGFFVSSDGYVLTNRHVVEDQAASYEVVWQHHHYPCDILVRDELTDIAILKIKPEKNKKFPYLKLGDSSKLKLGQTVIAIGNALSEFENTVSRGIISGLSRYVQTDLENINREFSGLIQTDAAINPGNSGGPLIDLGARVIGINTAVVLGVENISFAIPINQAKIILNEIKKYGKFIRPNLGIRYLLIDQEVQKEHHLPFNYGAFIIHESLPGQKGILPNGCADKAGLKEGDIILEINGKKIEKTYNLADALKEHQVGDKVKITYWHQGAIKQVDIVLER